MVSLSNPQFWPPDRSLKRDPTVQQEPLTTFEKIVRYAEKDDVLLYLTAIFGVVMPAIMYFVYKAAHAKYQVYAKQKREERHRNRAQKRAITFFYMTTSSHLKRLTYLLAEQLDGFEPRVVSLTPASLKIFHDYRGSAIFVIPDKELSSLPEADTWFFDWLQEMRFEANERNLLSMLNYAIFTVTEPEQEVVLGKMGNTLAKRLNALDAKEMQPLMFIWNNKETDMDFQLEHQGELLQDALKGSWSDYETDETELISAEDTMSEDEPEMETQTKKTD